MQRACRSPRLLERPPPGLKDMGLNSVSPA